MPAITPVKNLPYPLGTDRLMDGDDAIRRLAQSVENMCQGAIVQLPNLSAAGTPASIQWVYPVPFLAPPNVTATINGGSATVVVAGIQVAITSILAASCVIWGVRTNGTNGFQINVIAIGPVAAVA